MGNLSLYRERLEIEQNVQKERAQISDDLHGMVKNALVSIAAAAEVALIHLDRDHASFKQRLQSIYDLAKETGENLTKVLMVIEDDHPTWATFCGDLRSWGREWIADLGFEFDLNIAPSVFDLPPPSLQLRAGFYLIYREALTNARQHSRASRISGTLTCYGDRVICEIQDNGIGFDFDKVPKGHAGLRHMQRRAEILGGNLTITTQFGGGTHIRFVLPWKANSSKLEDASQGEPE
jgi:signal transduction histidine kinase